MQEIKFIKDHPSRKFKKGQIVDMPKENVEAWLQSGYAIIPKDIGENEGNVDASLKDGENLKKKYSDGGNLQSKFGKSKKKKRNKKRNK